MDKPKDAKKIYQNQYHLFTLDTNKLLENNSPFYQMDSNNAPFFCNLAEREIGRASIKKLECFYDNALFYQIIQTLQTAGVDVLRDDPDCLRNYIVFLNFKDFFSDKENVVVGNDPENWREKDLTGDLGRQSRLKQLFADNGGLELSFDGKERKRFVPFDTSGSMARNSRISFIDKVLRDQIEPRLLLDIDFSKIKLIPSKYYAYRGLYMSTAERIDQDEIFCLTKETVIVLPDMKDSIRNESGFFTRTGNKGYNLEFGVLDKPEHTMKMDFFDGEGLICPVYAGIINEKLKDPKRNNYCQRDSHSFQIRMPFTKGMLHEVDYDKFFSRYAGKKPLYIDDAFGCKRDLRKAKILLTRSMFKCYNWLCDWSQKRGIEDPMDYYFEKIKKYNHALYVTGTDAGLSNPGTVRMNSQFLSTLAIDQEDFMSLLADYKEKVDFIKIATERGGSKEQRKCLWALAKNPSFINDSKVTMILKDIQNEAVRNLCMGRIEVLGEQRYLSRDLMWLLINILQNTGAVDQHSSTMKAIKAKCLYWSSRHFYMPEAKTKMKAGKYYGFFRNPHLSRHEQCILRPLVDHSLYDWLFSHLTGVVMVPLKSFVPALLGGADFDGDLVKIVSDRRIVDAIKRGGAYREEKAHEKRVQGKKKKKKKEYLRAWPIIKIPDLDDIEDIKVKEEPAPTSISFETIRNTFSNQIGYISNLAVTIAKEEYAAKPRVNCKNKCAECTIVTGLEIDAAKTGFHPSGNITDLKKIADEIKNLNGKSGAKKNKDYYINAKETMKKQYAEELNKRRHLSLYVKETGEKEFALYLDNPQKWRGAEPLMKNIRVYDDEATVANIDRIPGEALLFCQELAKEKSSEEEKKTRSRKSDLILFNFQKEKGWQDSLDKDKKAKIAQLIKAYQNIRKRNSNLIRLRYRHENNNSIGYIYRILQWQYDSFNHVLKCGIKVEEAYSKAYETVKTCTMDGLQADEAITRLVKEKWHFTEKELRPEKLATILGVDEIRSSATVELLTNFRNRGYMLLYHLLKEIQSLATMGRELETDYGRSGGRLQIDEDEDTVFLPVLEEKYSNCTKDNPEYKLWHDNIVEKCREFLKEILDSEDMEVALRYVMSFPKADRTNFLWSIFTEKELLDAIAPMTSDDIGDGTQKEEQTDAG